MAENIQYEELTEELAKYVEANCSRLPPGQMRVSGCVLPTIFKQYAQKIIDFEVRSDDIWVLSYPKCGTTWTQEMVWLLSNDCDFETAKKVDLADRFPFLEFVAIGGAVKDDTIDQANSMSSPRLIKCHLPAHLLPKQIWTKKPRMIYVYRDPRDVAISYFHHMKLWYNYSGTMDQCINAFLEELLLYDPYWNHVIKFWELKDEPYMCFNTFEDMKKDLSSIIDKTCVFIGAQITEENKSKLIEHLSFSSMQKNEKVNYHSDKDPQCKYKDVQFIREGKSGGWKTQLSKQQVDRFDTLARKYLKNINFPMYEINSSK